MSPISNASSFTHLHLHSVYSLLDGAIRIKDLIQEVKRLKMNSVAITDHGNMFATVEFYEEAIKNKVKPIIGSEFYVAPGSRFEKKMVEKLADGQAYHLILLAKNKIGYQNLVKMSSKAYQEGFYRKPRIDYELLAQHSEGIICLTACLAGEVNRKLYQEKNQEAFELAAHLNELFGDGNFYLEIQDHGIPEQAKVTKGALDIHKRTGIPLVLTNDSHFLRREDQKAQDIMLRIQMNKKIDDPMEFGFNEEFYVKSPEEMKKIFPELPEAYMNTQRIDEMIDLSLDFGHPLLPNFEIPEGHILAEYLEKEIDLCLEKRFEHNVPDKYKQRKDYELKIIKDMGFEGYFLIVADFINFAKKNDIPVGAGRGSAAGSLIAYALGITNVDPLKHGLLFERFLNPSRNEMPDVDIDFCRDRREEVINYVVEKYGNDHVAQIITFGSLSTKAVIKDVARVLGYSFPEINAISKNLPDSPGISLKEAVNSVPEAKEFFNSGEREKTLWQVSNTLEGIPRNSGKHAAGIVIAPKPLDEIIPLAKDSKTGAIITQFGKNHLEKIGLVKMDFLGLKNLTIIKNTLKEIEKRRNIRVDIDNIPFDDPKVYELFQKGMTKGIFQVEKAGITSLLQRAKPDKFEDIVACIALYRPGPLQSGMADEYIKRKNGEERITYPLPELEPVLSDTFGTIVYQEQVMLIAQIIGGFSMSDADILRKAMGKKKMDVMSQMKEKFINGAKERKHNEKQASNLFDMMSKFGEYGFNKSHSVAYGIITYQTAYLKARYLPEFLKATLDADIESTEKLIGLIHSSREMGIEILPPDVNESDACFTIISDNKIRYGLLGLKGIGKVAVESVIKSRAKDHFKDIADLAGRIPNQYFNKKLLEALVFSGSVERLGHNRASLAANIDDILNLSIQIHTDRVSGQKALFGGQENIPSIQIKSIEDWTSEEKMKFEKETLGLYLTDHPLRKYKTLLGYTKITPLTQIDDGISQERKLTFIGAIEEAKMVSTKRGSNFLQATISDLSGRQNIRIYNSLYEKNKYLLKEGSVLIFECRASIYRDNENNPSIYVSVNEISAIEKLQNMIQKSLHIYLACLSFSELKEKIYQIKKILMNYSGPNPVYFHYKNNEGNIQVIKAHSKFFVDHKENLSTQLSQILISKDHIAWRVGNEVQFSDQSIKLS